jgi:uncharacterized protein
MLIAIISDTHLPRGSRRLPEECVQRLRGTDEIVHAGDFTALEVLEELRALAPRVIAVHGNVDSEELVRLLPTRTELQIGGVRQTVAPSPSTRWASPA